MKIIVIITLLAVFIPTIQSNKTIEVASWKFEDVRSFVVVCLYILCLLTIKYIHFKVKWVKDNIPESFILLFIGVVFGIIFRFGLGTRLEIKFEPKQFFLIILPPIILNSAYELISRSFYKVFGICIMFAVLGTIMNFLLIGFSIYGIVQGGVSVYGGAEITCSLNLILLFASLIVAVDPVAVLAIFSDIGVNPELYFIVFGESLLNDAVTVVIYEIMLAFVGISVVTGPQIALGVASFFTVSLGGMVIGIMFGVFTCLATKFETNTEVVTFILFSYMSYLLAYMVAWSGIIAIIACGMIQAEYGFNNISPESMLVIRKIVELWASLSEGIIFLFLGEDMAYIEEGWHTGFILWSTFICLVVRAFVTVILAKINNAINLENRRINWREMIIVIYGGLRGAVAFSLVASIEEEVKQDANLKILKSTTLFLILFTVGLHGITMKPLVKLLNIRRKEEEDLSLIKTTGNCVIQHVLPAIEAVCGDFGENAVHDSLVRFNDRHIRPLLQRSINKADDNFMKVIERISLAMHYAMIKPAESELYLNELPERVRIDHQLPLNPFFSSSDKNILGQVDSKTRKRSKVADSEIVDNKTLTTALERTRKISMCMPVYKTKDPVVYYKGLKSNLNQKQEAYQHIYGSKKPRRIHKNNSLKSINEKHDSSGSGSGTPRCPKFTISD